MSKVLSLDSVQEAQFQLWMDQVISIILATTGWVPEKAEWCWKVSGGAFLVYLRTPTDSPYYNTVSIIIPHPQLPLTSFLFFTSSNFRQTFEPDQGVWYHQTP